MPPKECSITRKSDAETIENPDLLKRCMRSLCNNLVIMFVANSTTNPKGISGGLRRFIELAKRWIAKGARVKLMGSDDDILLCQSWGLQDIKFESLPSFGSLKTCVPITYLMRTLAGCLKALNKPPFERTVFYSASDFWPDVLPSFLMSRKARNSRLVSAIHLIAPNPFIGPIAKQARQHKAYLRYLPRAILFWISQCVAIKLMSHSDLILCVNDEMLEFLAARGIERQKIRVVSNGVDLVSIRETQRSTVCFDACFVGRFHPQKGVLDLPLIWERVCKLLPEATLAIIGDGNQRLRRKLSQEINRRDLQHNVSILGSLPENEKISIMKSSKVFLFPSYYESFGIVAIEALACGLPVIAYDLPCFSKLGSMVTKVPIGDLERFSQAAIEYLENENLRRKHAEIALDFVSTFGWDSIADSELFLMRGLFAESQIR